MKYDTLSGTVDITHSTYSDRPTIKFDDFLPLASTLPIIHEGRLGWVFQHTMDEYVYLYKPSSNEVLRFNSTVRADE